MTNVHGVFYWLNEWLKWSNLSLILYYPIFCVHGWGKSNNLFWGQMFNNLWKIFWKKEYCVTKSLILLEKIIKKRKAPKTNDKNRCNYLQYERVLKFFTFIFWILSNLAKHSYRLLLHLSNNTKCFLKKKKNISSSIPYVFRYLLFTYDTYPLT